MASDVALSAFAYRRALFEKAIAVTDAAHATIPVLDGTQLLGQNAFLPTQPESEPLPCEAVVPQQTPKQRVLAQLAFCNMQGDRPNARVTARQASMS